MHVQIFREDLLEDSAPDFSLLKELMDCLSTVLTVEFLNSPPHILRPFADDWGQNACYLE